MQSSHPAVPIIDSHAKQKKEQRKKCHGRMTSGGISEERWPSVWMPSYVYIAEEMNPNFDRVLEKMAVKRHREHVEGGNCDPFWAFPSPLSSLLSKLELILYRYFCQLRAWATPHLIFFLFCQPTVQHNSIQYREYSHQCQILVSEWHMCSKNSSFPSWEDMHVNRRQKPPIPPWVQSPHGRAQDKGGGGVLLLLLLSI